MTLNVTLLLAAARVSAAGPAVQNAEQARLKGYTDLDTSARSSGDAVHQNDTVAVTGCAYCNRYRYAIDLML